ncbi:MAG: M20/M25/M40 family metallo-hydrolase [Chloroflexi bacterium]|nr:M20/M25/M40 family metallo-hydrolase [Chloroflexota bacterium]
MIKRDRIVKTLSELVQIDSPTGEEEAMAQELQRRLSILGLAVKRDAYGNLVASSGGASPLMLSAHMDTVEPGRNVRPRIQGDRLVSEGTTIVGGDCKAGIAAILEALVSLREDGVRHVPIEVVLTRSEEIGLVGARNLDYSLVSAKQAVVFDGEGPANQIVSSSPTYIAVDIDITGRAAHAGVEPEKGISAIRIAAEIIAQLPQGRLDPETTFNIGTIQGGSVRNAVPEKALVVAEFRSRNMKTLEVVRAQVMEVLQKARARFPEAAIQDKLHTEFETYTLTPEDPLVQRVVKALKGIGLEPALHPSGGGTDGNIFRLHGINAIVVGMADHNAHTVREYVDIPELVDAARLCEALLRT